MNDARVHLRLPPELVTWLKGFARRRRTTVSEVIRQMLLAEQDKEQQEVTVDAEQI